MNNIISEGRNTKETIDRLNKEIKTNNRFYEKFIVETGKLQKRLATTNYTKLGIKELKSDQQKLDDALNKTIEQSKMLDNLLSQLTEETQTFIAIIDNAYDAYQLSDNEAQKNELLNFIREGKDYLDIALSKEEIKNLKYYKEREKPAGPANLRIQTEPIPIEPIPIEPIPVALNPISKEDDFAYIIDSDVERAVVPTIVPNMKIFNPKDEPFGKLSNLYYDPIEIDTVPHIKCKGHLKNQYKTPVNYIYASMINTASYKNSVACARTDKVFSKFQKFYAMEQENIVKQAVKESNNSKFKQSKLKKLLLSTGKRPLYYISSNKTLGVDPSNGVGDNYLGKYLEIVRGQSRPEPTDVSKEILKAYLLFEFVEEQYLSGNDIFQFKDFSFKDVQNYVKTNYNPQDIKYKKYMFPDKSLQQGLLDLYNQGNLNNIANIVQNNRVLLPLVIQKNIEKRTQLLIDLIILKSYIQEQYEVWDNDFINEEEMDNIYSNLTPSQKKGIIDSYYNNTLEPKIIKRINDNIELVRAETLEQEIEINEQKIVLIDNLKLSDTKNEQVYNNEPIYFASNIENKYKVFAPNTSDGLIKIGSKFYPSVSHYIIAKLLTLIPDIRNLKNAYKYLLVDSTKSDVDNDDFLSLDLLTNNYHRIRDISYRDNLIKHTQTIMDIKFMNDEFKELLLLTGSSNIVYNDLQDSILGIGKNNTGENFVGKYLMELRNTIFNTYNTGKYPVLLLKDISNIYNYKYIREWFEMKVTDIAFTLKLVENFLNEQHKIHFGEDVKKYNTNIDYKLNHRILEIIYKHCIPINKQYKINPPAKFISFIKTKIRSPSKYVIKQIWDRILSQFEAVMTNTPVLTLFTFKQFTVLNSVRLSLAKCTKNCTVSALDNVIEDLHDVLKNITKIDVYNDTNIEYAKLLILGSKYKTKSKTKTDVLVDDSTNESTFIQAYIEEIEDTNKDKLDDDFDEIDYNDEIEDENEREYDDIDDSGVLTKTPLFIQSIKEIKEAKLPQTLKNNRIKYFATLI